MLSQKSELPHSDAFIIVPSVGYQRQSFDINIIDTSLIDYENVDWQVFNVDVSIEIFDVFLVVKQFSTKIKMRMITIINKF